MQLSPQVLFIVIIVFAIFMGSYSARSLKNKILCTLNRADRTKIQKWAKIDQTRIDMDGGWYEVKPECTTLRLWDSGIHFLFPTWVRCSDYRHGSAKPLNPDTYDNTYSAEERKQLDKTDDIRALEQGNQRSLIQGAGKQGLFQKYLPIIMIGGFLIIGWFLWQMQAKMNLLGAGQNYIEGVLGDIMSKLP